MESSETKIKRLSLSQAAQRTGYTPEYLNRLSREGILLARKIGRNWFIDEADLQAFEDWVRSPKYPKPGRKKEYAKIPLSQVAGKIGYTAKYPNSFFRKDKLPAIERNFSISPADIYAGTKFVPAKNKSLWPGLTAKFSFLVLLGLLFFSGVPAARYLWNNYEFMVQKIPIEVLENSWLFSNEPGKMEVAEMGKVKGEDTGSATGSISASEDFRLREISFGGVLLASAEGENLPLEILDLKTKTFLSRDGKEAQALISWKTNKLAVSEITYERIDNQLKKTLVEENFGFNHGVVLPGLDLGATYVFEIKARDKWDREILSDKFSVYTGSKIISVFDLIIKALNDTFSWAIKE